jgi:hypothetical protein
MHESEQSRCLPVLLLVCCREEARAGQALVICAGPPSPINAPPRRAQKQPETRRACKRGRSRPNLEMLRVAQASFSRPHLAAHPHSNVANRRTDVSRHRLGNDLGMSTKGSFYFTRTVCGGHLGRFAHLEKPDTQCVLTGMWYGMYMYFVCRLPAAFGAARRGLASPLSAAGDPSACMGSAKSSHQVASGAGAGC